jgi:hypothetical protein
MPFPRFVGLYTFSPGLEPPTVSFARQRFSPDNVSLTVRKILPFRLSLSINDFFGTFSRPYIDFRPFRYE